VYKAKSKVRQQLTLQSLIIDNQCRRQGLDLSKSNTLTGRDQLIAVITTSYASLRLFETFLILL